MPELPSAFGENWHPYSEPRPVLELRFGRKPPSKSDILQWCRSRQLGVTTSNVVDHREDEEEDTLNAGNKTCLRIRRDSEDSIGSEMSMSPPSSATRCWAFQWRAWSSPTSTPPTPSSLSSWCLSHCSCSASTLTRYHMQTRKTTTIPSLLNSDDSVEGLFAEEQHAVRQR